MTTDQQDRLVEINSHGPLARLGGKAGEQLWETWEAAVRRRHDHYAELGLTVLTTTDDNKHGSLPDFGTGFHRIGGIGIDLIGKRPVADGAHVEVVDRKSVRLHIDGHNGHGAKLKVTWPSGRGTVFWLVQANLGRHESPARFTASCVALREAFGLRAVYGFDEIDEADKPYEHELLRGVFPLADGFEAVGWGGLSPTLAGPVLTVKRAKVTLGCPGLAGVSPARDVVETVLTPPTGTKEKP